jgi:ElaB/YqjD/DUF883 family membrane-anchored ribosome-binding protein
VATAKDKESPAKDKELDAGKESLLAAYRNLLDAQAHFQEAAEAAGQDLQQEALAHLLKGKSRTDELSQELQRYLREKPLATLGLAFVTGLIVSQLLSRK